MRESKRRRQHRLHVSAAIAAILLSFSLEAVPIVDAVFLDRKLAAVAAAGIFGGRRGGSASNDTPSSQQISSQRVLQHPPPPPQPPGARNAPVQQAHKSAEHHPIANVSVPSDDPVDSVASEQIESPVRGSIPHPPNRPMTQDGVQIPPTESLHPAKMGSASSPSTNEYWPSQQHHTDEILSYQEQLFYLHRDLEAAYLREQQLLADLQNLTVIASDAKQREKLHMHQLDVLTERVIDVENAAAHDHNQLLEYQLNCTELAQNLEMQQRSTEEWREKCESLLELRAVDEANIRDLQEKVKSASREAETLASMIEKYRLLQEGTVKKKKKKMGFFAWLFNFGSSSDDEDEDYREVFDEARSSLLSALQTERNSVSDLEAALVTLQQNNSAISEQVQSRDQIIDELNNRIAVFEEDKVVLKAALRQLQMEMNDEAPKTHKLVDDLAHAEEEVERLSEKIDSLMESHRIEISNLKISMKEKVDELKAAESNLTIIGTYVEKLEERLADFTVARREVEERELACSELEKKVAEIQEQREAMQGRILELEKEHDELKVLLSELAEERSKLLESTKKSSMDRSSLEQTVQSLRQSYAILDNEARDLREQTINYQSQINLTENKLNETAALAGDLMRRLEASEAEKQELQKAAETFLLGQRDWQEKLDEAGLTKHALESRVVELEQSLQVTLAEFMTYSEETKKTIENMEQEVLEARTIPVNVSTPDAPVLTNFQSHTDAAVDAVPLIISGNLSHALVPAPSVATKKPRRYVPLRKIRKFFAKATGVHGLFAKPTHR